MENIQNVMDAIKLVDKYNNMNFDDFILEVENYLGVEFDLILLNEWKFTGLNNIDFLKQYF